MRYYIYLDKELLRTLYSILDEDGFNIDVFEFSVRNSYTVNNNFSLDPSIEKSNDCEDFSKKDWKENYSSTARDNRGERKRVNVSYDNGNSYNYQTERKYLNITDITDMKNIAFYHDLFEKIRNCMNRDSNSRIFMEEGFIKINNDRNLENNMDNFFMINNSFIWYDKEKLKGDIKIFQEMSCKVNIVGYKMNCMESERNILKAIAIYIQ